MKRLMFQTLGVGSSVVQSAIHAIQVYNPDHLVLFTTEYVREQTLVELLQRLHVSSPEEKSALRAWRSNTVELEGENETWPLNWRVGSGTYEGLLVSVPTQDDLERFNNAERLHISYQRLIDDAFERFAESPQRSRPHAVADYTRGTRPMSAALFGAAYASGIPIIAYVGGERDDAGFVIPGTETIHQTQGQRLRSADTLGRAVQLFNTGDFSAAAGVAQTLQQTPAPRLPFEGRGVRLVSTASEAFGAWDRFRFQEALDALQRLGDEVDAGFAGRNLMTKRQREQMQRHLHQAREAANGGRDDANHIGLAADLVANADRRIRSEAFDDALGRLYRALEFLAQVRVRQRFEVSTEAVPVTLLREQLDEPIAGEEPDDDETKPIGMKQAWELLQADGDELGAVFRDLCENHELLVSIGMRNSSILAHGFEPVEPKYVEVMRRGVIRLSKKHWGDERWERALETCRFPRIDDM